MANEKETGVATGSSSSSGGGAAAAAGSSSVTSEKTKNLYKVIALVVLTIQNAMFVLIMKASQTSQEEEEVKYLPSVAVFMGEVIKLGCSLLLLSLELKSIQGALLEIKTFTIDNPYDFALVSVPAFLYVVQNNLAFLATKHLDPAPFQLLYQLKIFSTAFLSMLILKKVLTGGHWRALLLLFAGVCFVQYSTLLASSDASGGRLLKGVAEEKNPLVGLGAILIAVVCSGFSGVWFEKILKTKPGSIWTRNFQLAFLSLIIGAVQIYVSDYDRIIRNGFLGGFNEIVWVVVLTQSLGGLLVAIVVKYADNILKGFATSLATVLSIIGSILWFNFKITPYFLVGAVMVLASAFFYNSAEDAQKKQKELEAAANRNNEESISLVRNLESNNNNAAGGVVENKV